MKFLKLVVLVIPFSFVYGSHGSSLIWAQDTGFNAVEKPPRSADSSPKTSETTEPSTEAPPPAEAPQGEPSQAPQTSTSSEPAEGAPTNPTPASAEPSEPVPPPQTSTSDEPSSQTTEEPELQGSASSGEGNPYPAVYKTGETPFQEKTKMKIRKSGDAFLFIPEKGEAWNLPVKDIRGAVTSPKGLWFYWFDEGGHTLSGYFKMDDGNTYLASEVNDAVNEFHQRPIQELNQYKAHYEEYKTEAIKDAR